MVFIIELRFFKTDSPLKGNPDVHVILRGGVKGPNFAAEFVRDAGQKLDKAGLPQKIMVGVLFYIRTLRN